MHIYAFGSICRGEISYGSDVDLLAIVAGYDDRLDPHLYSIYSYRRVNELWGEGNPFAWHLSLESRLVFAFDEIDFLKALGDPAPYKHHVRDCEKFLALFRESYESIARKTMSTTFDLSTVFLSIRNFATCFSLGKMSKPSFSRNAALGLGSRSIPIPENSYRIFERARILCTRGHGTAITDEEIAVAIGRLDEVEEWMKQLIWEAKGYGRL